MTGRYERDEDFTILLELVDRCDHLAHRMELYHSDPDAFCEDDVVLDAIAFNIVGLGVGLSNLSDAFKARHPEVLCERIMHVADEAIEDVRVDVEASLDEAANNVPLFRKKLVRILTRDYGYDYGNEPDISHTSLY